MIGPHRGGRTVGAVGVRQQPNVFYIGVNNGGVWKTTDYGRTWNPIFDEQATGSIGDIVIAPSNPEVLYVGSGEGLQRPDLSVGKGIYKSVDGGKTWTPMGLSGAQQIGGLAIDPTNENRVFVAALGHPYGPNAERGVYRTMDGGKSWQQVLFLDENTGAIEVAIDPKNPNTIYADLWAARLGPWENGSWNGPQSGLYKSMDGGSTWKKLSQGLPSTQQGLGRIGFTISPSEPQRLYATVDAGDNEGSGIYRSDNGGETWISIQNDSRLFARGSDFAEIKVDPQNADIVYTANVVTWKSMDGGKTWKDFRGAPGGDDYHRIWINPDNSDIMLIASDQGAIITVNGGKTFSSWYNQPTAQFYHVSTDNSFPYNVYGGQQESGSVGIASRGNDGAITFREWHPVGAQEYGYVAADPLNPNLIYGGKLSRYDKRTGQTQEISPVVSTSEPYRFIRTAPLIFSPIDQKSLYYAGNVLFKTMDGGNSWQVISPDLSRPSWKIPASVGIYTSDKLKTMARRGVIYTIAPSSKDINTIWCGTDDGFIHKTTNGGKTWTNITPPEIEDWSKISIIDAGHFDKNTAYAAVNKIRLDDMHPHIYKTKDGGVTWKEIVEGLPEDPINVVREDPMQQGLLFAGSETSVYVSFDDGTHWQSLRLNMPASSIRDLVIKDNDLVIATHGRSFWILDDIETLRQLPNNKNKGTQLYQPATAYRVRWNTNTDTPLPQEEPAGENPPDGAIIDYYLQQEVDSVIKLEIRNDKGQILRTYSSLDTAYHIGPVNIPLYWIRPEQKLSNLSGHHRFIWDLHYTPLSQLPTYPIAAIYQNTAPTPTAPLVMPGNYQLKLLVGSKEYKKSLRVKMDPRIQTSQKELQVQHDLSLACYLAQKDIAGLLSALEKKRSQLTHQERNPESKQVENPKNKDEKLNSKEVSAIRGAVQSLNQLNENFVLLFQILQGADMPPTLQVRKAVATAVQRLRELRKDKAILLP
ncbi:MAG: hypothetical protein NVSMB67_26530 [Flavisolibacter sp.]